MFPPLGLESHHTSASLSVALIAYGCTSRGARQRLQLSLCAPRTQVVENKRQRGSERTVKVLLPLHSGRQDGTVADASRRGPSFWGYATLSQDGVRPPPGRTAPQVLLSLPALQLSRESDELLAPLLTESVQEARSAVSVGDGQRVCLVLHYREVKKEMDDIGSAGLGF